MRFYNYLNENQENFWEMTFDEFMALKDNRWWIESEVDDVGLKYTLNWKEGKKTKGKSLYANNAAVKKQGNIYWSFYYLFVKYNIDDVKSFDVIKQFKDEDWAQHKYKQMEKYGSIGVLDKVDIVNNKDVKAFIKKTDVYKDYLKFLRGLYKDAENSKKFTWNDVQSIANKLNIEIDHNMVHSASVSAGEAGVGSKNVSIRTKYVKTDYGVQIFFHELAHAVLVSKGGRNPWTTTKKIKLKDTEWIEIFNLLGWINPKGAVRTSQTERYARLIELFFVKNKDLKQNAPTLYSKVFDLMDDMAVYLTIQNYYGGIFEFKKNFAQETGN